MVLEVANQSRDFGDYLKKIILGKLIIISVFCCLLAKLAAEPGGRYKTNKKLRLADRDQQMEWHSEKTFGAENRLFGQHDL